MNVNYEEGMLIIKVPTDDPVAMREKLIHGLNTAMRNYIVSKDCGDDQLALIHLQKSLLPTEKCS